MLWLAVVVRDVL